MSLRPEELDIIKQQLGVVLTRVGAEPYLQYIALFDRVIYPYLYDNSTTSSTTVAANAGNTALTVAANPAAPNNAQLLTFNVGTSVVVDVGGAQETTTIGALSGLSFAMNLVNAHTAPYPIWPNGAEWAVRGILARIVAIEGQLNQVAPYTAGVAKADEGALAVSMRGGRSGRTLDKFDSLVAQRMQARDDLSGAVGFPNLWREKRNGTNRVELY